MYIHCMCVHACIWSHHSPVHEGHSSWIDADRDVGIGGHVVASRWSWGEDTRPVRLTQGVRVRRGIVTSQLHRCRGTGGRDTVHGYTFNSLRAAGLYIDLMNN